MNFVELYPAKLLNDFILVFLHEALGSISQWKSFPQQLCDTLGAKGVVYERIGHGNSLPMATKRGVDYLHVAAFDELPLFLHQNHQNHTYVLVGHSDGGSIALLHAAKEQQNCIGVITMAAHVFVEAETLAGILPAIEAFENGKLKKALEKYHGDNTNTLFYAWAHTWLSDAFASWNIEKELSSIACPVLAIQGADDQYGTEKQLDAIVSAVGSNKVTKVYLPNCGHAPHLEANDEVLATIQRWAKLNLPLENGC